jgi:predicted transcriptional regulator
MSKPADHNLSRRERQIMDVLYQRHRASAADIRESIPNAPSYSAVRALLRILEEKGYIRHEERDLRYVYFPAAPGGRARRKALRHLVETFFDGSAVQAVATLLDPSTGRVSEEDLDQLAILIEKVRKGGG